MKVTLQNVTKNFGSTVAVKDFSAELTDGHLICLLGPSGCGKSTILNMLCGIIPVSQGHIFFDDKDVTNVPPDKRNIGMVFQNYALYPHLTVLDNIAFPLEVQKVSKKERRQKAEEIAKLVHVDNFLTRYPGELSGGQQQRVAIARALIKKPSLLLMDEPLSNLDARLRLELREEIRRIQQETGVTTVFVTHDQEEAMSISDSIILMKDGVLVQSGLCQDLYKNPNCRFTAEFLGNPKINRIVLPDPDGKEKVWYIRPESFVLSGKAGTSSAAKNTGASEENISAAAPQNPRTFSAHVERISEMGKERIVILNINGQSAHAIFNDDSQLTEGTEIQVSLKNKGVFFFDE